MKKDSEEFKINESEIDALIADFHANPSREARDRLNQIILEQKAEFEKVDDQRFASFEKSKSKGREM